MLGNKRAHNTFKPSPSAILRTYGSLVPACQARDSKDRAVLVPHGSRLNVREKREQTGPPGFARLVIGSERATALSVGDKFYHSLCLSFACGRGILTPGDHHPFCGGAIPHFHTHAKSSPFPSSDAAWTQRMPVGYPTPERARYSMKPGETVNPNVLVDLPHGCNAPMTHKSTSKSIAGLPMPDMKANSLDSPHANVATARETTQCVFHNQASRCAKELTNCFDARSHDEFSPECSLTARRAAVRIGARM